MENNMRIAPALKPTFLLVLCLLFACGSPRGKTVAPVDFSRSGFSIRAVKPVAEAPFAATLREQLPANPDEVELRGDPEERLLASSQETLGEFIARFSAPEGWSWTIQEDSYSGKFEAFLLANQPEITWRDLANIASDKDPYEQCVLTLTLTPSGAKEFHELSASHVDQRLALMRHDQVLAVPTILEAIPGGVVQVIWSRTTECERAAEQFLLPN
jgi:hypothetical protein